ncbi:MAG: DEAD/DEAH box helicase, partial [Eggerthellaceae bacterium]|nr:DEAD/DEAH box helicase [Eggerthellaceae bacterium]
MFIDALYERVGALSPLAETFEDIALGNDAHLKVVSSARPLVVALEFARSPKPTLVVVPGADGAKSFARTLEEFVGPDKVILYPDISPNISSDQYIPVDIVCARARAQYCLTKSEQVIVVASGASVASKILPQNYAAYAPLVVKQDVQPIDAATGEVLTFENFIHALALRGYENTATPDGAGTFGIHGGTIDIQLPGVSYIVRLDFFGDEVDSIRRVIPGTFQEISSLQMCEIFPVRPYKVTKKNFKQAAFALATLAKTNPAYRNLYDKASTHIDFPEAHLLMPFMTSEEKDPEKALVSLGDYMPKDALVILSEPRSIIDDVGHFYQDVESYAAVAKMNVHPYLQKPMQLNFGKSPRLMLSSISQVGEKQALDLPIKRPDIAGSIERLFDRLHMFMEQKMLVVLSIPHYRAREDIEMQLVHEGFSIKNHCDTAGEGFDVADEAALTPGVVHIIDHELEQGMVIPKLHCALISIHDLQGQARRVRKRKRVDITETTFPYKPGDYVVHAFHGVALFQGIVEQKTDAGIRDYLQLDYAGGDKLYVPVDRLDRVTRYVGSGEGEPRLTRLNSTDWSRAVARATKATKKLAFDLLDIYSRRSAIKGYAFSNDTVWQKEMEDSFPYIETPDQLQAIEDVKADMQSSKPMDRLICGDVGFGKTEVALRAAFKAAGDGKQVMVLCPTTILAQQHFNTFHDRFDQFGVRVEVLSRFKTVTEQRKIIDDFSQGDVAVLVGTHRLLSRDIIPKDLGLVIIDEEQRFGVGHKEQLKNLREHIDVLTLSATPIPRTMQMSLSGVRDMSLILTPPTDRRPVEVHVGEWDIDIVSDAIRNEIQRGGQVYYVSNRVRTLDDAYERVHTAVPEARIGFAHGKLDKKSLEQVMEDFSAGAFDVLVATTIIESGIDNPHTNTLIIEDAHRLGLAQ